MYHEVHKQHREGLKPAQIARECIFRSKLTPYSGHADPPLFLFATAILAILIPFDKGVF